VKLRELRRQCERFTRKMLAQGANPDELAGLLLGSMMRVMRDGGVSRDMYMKACALLWENNNPTDVPVDDEEGLGGVAAAARMVEALAASPASRWVGNKIVGNTWLQKCTRCGAQEKLEMPPNVRSPADVPAGFDEELFRWKRDFQIAHEGCAETS
jgi:hypothetical protein